MKQKPLKRHKALQPLSREHHHGLLLSWKIRSGFSKNIEVERIKAYADWFFEHQLIPHFNLEEAHIFSILEPDNELLIRAMAEHRSLKRLFSDTKDVEQSLHKIEEELEQHIRFEERILFPAIQLVATEKQLDYIAEVHEEVGFEDNVADEFWK